MSAPGPSTQPDTDLAVAFTVEHREIDDDIERFLADPGDTDSLRDALRTLRRHIYLEEEYMFPPLREGGLMMPIMVMMREHGELWRAMDSIEAADSPTDAAAAAQHLLSMLAEHNAKEEPIVYPHAVSELDEADTAELNSELAEGTMPEGWTCATA